MQTKLVYNENSTKAVPQMRGNELVISPLIVAALIEMASTGDDTVTYAGVSLAMINQQLPEVLSIESWAVRKVRS